MRSTTTRGRRKTLAAAGVGFLAVTGGLLATLPGSAHAQTTGAPSGVAPGAIKHVWLIILENKSYDESFTGLNNNTYLWKTLPSQGALLKDYYGTGHFSLDNYISLTSGQAPAPDTQADCGGVHADGSNISYSPVSPGTPAPDGQVNATSGCIYPSSVQTLWNQFDAKGVSWKGYMQDLGNTPGREPGACGAPPAGSTTAAGTYPSGATPTDQYVPKHNPFVWFQSLLSNPTDCGTGLGTDNSGNDGKVVPESQLAGDLQSEATTPAFSWITPNNCSDAHDAVCKGDNLSGNPNNHTGGLYASDIFLQQTVPEIEASPAFKDGGLIDITFDEAFPPYTNDGSFANRQAVETAKGNIAIADSAVNREPTGPNTPLGPNGQGSATFQGPGDNAFIDRTPVIAPARTDAVSGSAYSSEITDATISATDSGAAVTGINIPSGARVGQVNAGVTANTCPALNANQNPCNTSSAHFQLVDAQGKSLRPTGPVSMATITATSDPLYDANDPTPGGGRTGSVLISPFIKPGTVTSINYNHYNWLRSMEDIFQVGTSGSITGSDGQGHLGYAGASGLRDFGADVFTNPTGTTPTSSDHTPLTAGVPLAAVAVSGGVLLLARRRRATASRVA